MHACRYICKTCQDQLAQWEKLHNNMIALKQQLITKFDTLCNTGQSTAGQVRPPAVPPKSLAPKRLKLDPGTSPEVVVSYYLSYNSIPYTPLRDILVYSHVRSSFKMHECISQLMQHYTFSCRFQLAFQELSTINLIQPQSGIASSTWQGAIQERPCRTF